MRPNNKTDGAALEVVPFAPVRGAYTYLCPRGDEPAALLGCRVMVPFSGRSVLGVVVGLTQELPSQRLLAIGEVLDETPVFTLELVSFLRWTANYYLAFEGELFRAALPPALSTREVQLLRLTALGREALEAQKAVLRRMDLSLDAHQEALLTQIVASRRVGRKSRRVQGKGSILRSLLARGLVENYVLQQHARPKTDMVLELAPEQEVVGSLARAPRQAALLEQVRAAGGRILLGDLADRPPQARDLARKLQDKGLLRTSQVEVTRDPFEEVEVPPDPKHQLNDDQQRALGALESALSTGFAPFLLHGVTGSGKTEVYLHLIARVLENGKGAIVLVPEIALTPQLSARFRACFGEQVAVLHSGLTDGQRYDQWRQIRTGRRPIVVGARSAIFAPIPELGAVIVDEEHDGSFKQEEGARYNARDLALVRAMRNKALVVLGSATPSLESWRGGRTGRLRLLSLPNRATPRPLPQVEVIDLRQHSTGGEGILSGKLALAIEETLAAKEQTILFLNRRGFSPLVHCRACGHVFGCEHCSVSLTHHRRHHQLVCHYCGYTEAPPECCSSCGSEKIDVRGFGTERVEQVLAEQFPRACVGRLDRDTASGRGLQQMLGRMQRQEVDILIGTQMVTKGHDFPGVTLVGVVCADHGLHFPDFRASERTFQLLTQVAGRAGRGERPGRVLIQTYSPDHPAVLAAQTHGFEAFCQGELASRQELLYPPFAHLASVHVDGEDAAAVEKMALEVAAFLLPHARRVDVAVLGPVEAPLQRIKGRTRWLLLLKARERAKLRVVSEALMALPKPAGGIRVTLDIDPQQML